MAIPNFAKPGGAAPVMGQDTLSSGSGTVTPQMRGIGGFPVMNQLPGSGGAKPAQQKPMEVAPSIGGSAQELAGRMLPRFNNGNPMGANNMPSGIQDFFNRNRMTRDRLYGQQGEYTTMPVYNTQDVRNRAIGIGQRQLPGDPNYFGGQAPGVGRYRPPTMDERGRWQDSGGYNYNLPNAFGSYPGYGQGDPSSGSRGPGYDSLYGGGQNPQFQQVLQQLMMYLQGGGRGG